MFDNFFITYMKQRAHISLLSFPKLTDIKIFLLFKYSTNPAIYFMEILLICWTLRTSSAGGDIVFISLNVNLCLCLCEWVCECIYKCV